MSDANNNNVGLNDWSELWTAGTVVTTDKVPPNMQADWNAWFDKIPPNSAVAWCNGTLVKVSTGDTFYFDFQNLVTELRKDMDLAEVSKINIFIRNAFRDNYKYLAP